VALGTALEQITADDQKARADHELEAERHLVGGRLNIGSEAENPR